MIDSTAVASLMIIAVGGYATGALFAPDAGEVEPVSRVYH